MARHPFPGGGHDGDEQRDGEFTAEELGMELGCSHYAAGKRMDLGFFVLANEGT